MGEHCVAWVEQLLNKKLEEFFLDSAFIYAWFSDELDLQRLPKIHVLFYQRVQRVLDNRISLNINAQVGEISINVRVVDILKQIPHELFVYLTLHFIPAVQKQDVAFALSVKDPRIVGQSESNVDVTFIWVFLLLLLFQPFIIMLLQVLQLVDFIVIEDCVVYLLPRFSFDIGLVENVQDFYSLHYLLGNVRICFQQN